MLFALKMEPSKEPVSHETSGACTKGHSYTNLLDILEFVGRLSGFSLTQLGTPNHRVL